jgi:copper chaperone
MAEGQEHQHHYKFNIVMSCGGCSGAIDRVLKKLDGSYPPLTSAVVLSCALYVRSRDYSLEGTLPSLTRPRDMVGVEKYEVSLEKQTADVYTERLDYDTVLKTIRKTGKKVISGEADGKEASVDDSKVASADEPAIVTGAE